MWDYLCLFLCTGDVMKSGAYDRMNQIGIINLHLGEGYATHSDWVKIRFKMI